SSRRRHTRFSRDWSSDVCSSDLLVHHATAGPRLDDVLPLVEEDPRIQVLYTCPPGSVFADTGAEYVRRLGARTVPWSEVPKHRFALAVAASLGTLASVAAPIPAVGPGTGPGKPV